LSLLALGIVVREISAGRNAEASAAYIIALGAWFAHNTGKECNLDYTTQIWQLDTRAGAVGAWFERLGDGNSKYTDA
jgi:hypothetical protein